MLNVDVLHKGGKPCHLIAKSINYRLMQRFAHFLIPLLQEPERVGLQL